MIDDCANCAMSNEEPCDWCCEVPPEISVIKCRCWWNPETGYLEACPEHEAQIMDEMMEFEAKRDASITQSGKEPRR